MKETGVRIVAGRPSAAMCCSIRHLLTRFTGSLSSRCRSAGTLIAEHGADASLEEVARRAGVGSATLHRHFPSRQVLLEAVFKGRVETLCVKAGELLTAPGPGQALSTWLRAVGTHAVTNRGLAASLMRDADPALGETCHDMITNAAMAAVEASLDGRRHPATLRYGRPLFGSALASPIEIR
ncbi:TetR/AcrR family transcriptional regulator [Streptomyces albireticuli]|nr:TetR/AcrR family transcriptional regulator [Streptomyces albireticuli]